MSHRAPQNDAFYFRLPRDLPIVVHGRPVQDSELSSRVEKALLADLEINNSSWRPKPTVVAESGFRRLWDSVRGYVAIVVSWAAAFSLGHFAGARH